ncbi:hypothetical protein BMW26_01405 [Microbacterium sp. 1.5R]|uniref:ABC transporter permease n=1 Tax=Microbacterium sp. 1.5R TaxID=1916917 RepID=UPI00090B095D|nr:FtsX-like permease family protein [Microbacterium sp. 1.5R]APH43759.1 hypothetical protein BMW26_01405 [Microbacterium sp. 1.5R]
MLALSRATVTERWPLFIGAVLSVALGVALVQSSLLLLLTAATTPAPAGASAIEATAHTASTTVAVTVLAVTLAFAAFLAFFIIGTTFAFTVDQRSRDIALLRLVGASRRQVRRLLVNEAALLGIAGALVGVPLGVAVMTVHADLLTRLGFVPEGFAARWQVWVLGASAATGIALAVGGVLLAARRAAGIAPLSALRDGEDASPVMTRGRWIIAALFGAGALALLALAPVGGAAGGQAMAMNVSIAAAIALTAAAPLLVPLAARLVPVGSRGISPLLARASLRDNVRRSASTAAPLVVLVGILVGQSTALLSFADAGATAQRASTVADVVVISVVGDRTSDPWGDRGIASVEGVAAVSSEVTLPAAITTGEGALAFTEVGTITVIEGEAYAAAHPTAPTASLDDGSAIAGPGSIGVGAGDRVGVRVGDVELPALEVTGVAEPSIAAGPTLYLSRSSLPDDVLAGAETVSFVAFDEDTDLSAIAGELDRYGGVVLADQWFEQNAAASSGTATSILIVVLGLGALYALIGVVNSIVIASASRSREFAVARVSGLTRSLVLRTALLESLIVTSVGLVLGLLAAAGTVLAVVIVTATVTGSASMAVPWALVATVIIGAYAVAGTTTLLTSSAAMRPAPVTLVRGRE